METEKLYTMTFTEEEMDVLCSVLQESMEATAGKLDDFGEYFKSHHEFDGQMKESVIGGSKRWMERLNNFLLRFRHVMNEFGDNPENKDWREG